MDAVHVRHLFRAMTTTLNSRWKVRIDTSRVRNIVLGCQHSSTVTDCYLQLFGLGSSTSKFSQLTSVDLGWCNTITNKGLHFIAEGCPNIRTLSIAHCDKITDSGIHDLVTKCSQLNAVNLNGCSLITNESLHTLSKLSLVSLDLSNIPSITDEGIHSLVNKCPLLTSFKIANNSHITCDSLLSLVQGCPLLRELELGNVGHLNWFSIPYLLPFCPQLQYIGLSHCDITDQCMNAIVAKCSDLSRIEIIECHRITPSCVAAIVHDHPPLEIITSRSHTIIVHDSEDDDSADEVVDFQVSESDIDDGTAFWV